MVVHKKNNLVKVEGNKTFKLIRYWKYLYDSGYWDDKNYMYLPSLDHPSKL